MKKVTDTKNLTVRQMISMSENLQEKFKVYSSVQISADSYKKTIETRIEYHLYVENKHCKTFKSWQELLSFYRKLMKEKS